MEIPLELCNGCKGVIIQCKCAVGSYGYVEGIILEASMITYEKICEFNKKLEELRFRQTVEFNYHFQKIGDMVCIWFATRLVKGYKFFCDQHAAFVSALEVLLERRPPIKYVVI